MTERVYVICDKRNQALYLVCGSTPAQAVNRLTAHHYDVRIPRPIEVAQMMEAGHKVLRGNGEPFDHELFAEDKG
jgi:hypothetical protein